MSTYGALVWKYYHHFRHNLISNGNLFKYAVFTPERILPVIFGSRREAIIESVKFPVALSVCIGAEEDDIVSSLSDAEREHENILSQVESEHQGDAVYQAQSETKKTRKGKPKSFCPLCREKRVNLDSHECVAGVCPQCGCILRNVSTHSCKLLSFRNNNVSDTQISQYLREHGRQCVGCERSFGMVGSNFQEWYGMQLCRDCYQSEYIQNAVTERWSEVQKWCIENGQAHCASCKLLIYAPGGKRLAESHFDHRDFWNKAHNICDMVRRGDSLRDIIQELRKCQVLCLCCHSRVTAAEHLGDFIGLKTARTRAEKSQTTVLEKYVEVTNGDTTQEALQKIDELKRASYGIAQTWSREVEELYHPRMTQLVKRIEKCIAQGDQEEK
jgi:hypothetical protein